MAAGIQLVHGACVRRAAAISSSVEVAARVADNSRRGVGAIGLAREAVQHSLMAGRIHLVYDTEVRRAATASSSIEVAGRVADHSCVGPTSIGTTREAVQHRLMAGGIHLVYDACVRRATIVSSSVEVAGRVADHARLGVGSFRRACKVVQHDFTRAMRRRSVTGPILLILLGAGFLIYNLRPDIELFDLLSQYWPFMLIAWGSLRLVEVLVDYFRGSLQNAS